MLSSAYSQRKVLTSFTGWLSPAKIVLWKCLFLFIACSKHWRWAFIPCVSRAPLIAGWNSVCELRSRLYRKTRNTPEASGTKSIYTSRDQAQHGRHGLVNMADDGAAVVRISVGLLRDFQQNISSSENYLLIITNSFLRNLSIQVKTWAKRLENVLKGGQSKYLGSFVFCWWFFGLLFVCFPN